jgi:hypothetical protein
MGSEYTDSHDKASFESGVAFQHVLQIFESWFGLRLNGVRVHGLTFT